MDPGSANSPCESPNAPKKQPFPRNDMSNVSEVLDHFHLFPRLSLELREMIWRYAMGPRVITWNRQQKSPGVMHACFESRRLWMQTHKIDLWKSTLFDHKPLFIDYGSDILYFEEVVPGFSGWREIPKHINITDGRLRHGVWLTEVERLAIPYELAMEEFDVIIPIWWRDPIMRWKTLSTWCPNLRELIVIFGRGGGKTKERGFELQDLVEMSAVKLPVEPWCWRWDTPNFRVNSFRAGKMARVRMLEVKFVKVKATTT